MHNMFVAQLSTVEEEIIRSDPIGQLIEVEKILVERRDLEQQLPCLGLPIQREKAVHLLRLAIRCFQSGLGGGRRRLKKQRCGEKKRTREQAEKRAHNEGSHSQGVSGGI